MDPNMPGMDHDMPGMDMGDGMGMGGESNGFCVPGGGRVMYSGFTFVKDAQPGGHGGGTCPLYLFQGAVVDSPGKYAGAIIGTFLLAMAMEGARYARAWLRSRRPALAKDRHVAVPILLEALLFGVHMLLAYLVMLLVMLYEAALFIAILLGLATGYLIFELLTAHYAPTLAVGVGGGCCDKMAPAMVAAEATAIGAKDGSNGNGNGDGTFGKV